VLRKVPHLCRPFINGVEDPVSFDADVKARLTRIEDLLSNLVPTITAQSQSSSSDARATGGRGGGAGGGVDARASRAPREFGIRPAMEGILSGGGEEVFHPDRSGEEGRGEMDVDMDFHAPIPMPVTTSTPPIPLPLHPATSAASRRRITLSPPSKDVAAILATLSESGIEKESLMALLMSVPDKGMADSLIE